jgi:hypothetical protein
MATYLEEYNQWISETGRKRTVVALLELAGTILAEDGTVTDHTYRLQWAADMYADPLQMALAAYGYIGVAVPPTTATDTDYWNAAGSFVEVYVNVYK